MPRFPALPLLAVAGTAALALPAAASAQDYCVNAAPGCQGTQISGVALQSSLIAAETNGTDDRFILGPGVVSGGPWTYVSTEGLDIIGAGVAKTTLAGNELSSTVLTLSGGPQVTVRNLTVKAGPLPQHGLVLTGARGSHVDVVDDPAAPLSGMIDLSGGAVLDHAHTAATNNYAVAILNGAGTVTDSELSSQTTVAVVGGGTEATLRRDRLAGAAGAGVVHGHMTVSDTLVDLRGQSSVAFGFAAMPQGQAADHSAALDVDRATIIGDKPAATDQAGVYAYAPKAGDKATVHVRSSVVFGVGMPVIRFAGPAGHADLASAFDAYGPPLTNNQEGPGTLTEEHIVGASPRFADVPNGDFHLRADSALLDAASPGLLPAGSVDLDGAARVTDGDGDCKAIVDIGAFERAAAAPKSGSCTPAGPPATTDPAPTPEAVTPTPTPAGKAPVAPAELVAALSPLADPAAPTASAKVGALSITGVKVSPIRLVAGRRANLRFTLSRAATVQVRFKRLGKQGRRATVVPAALRHAEAAGASRLRFTVRAARGAHLIPGRYALVVTATDAAGVRSAPVTARFSIAG